MCISVRTSQSSQAQRVSANGMNVKMSVDVQERKAKLSRGMCAAHVLLTSRQTRLFCPYEGPVPMASDNDRSIQRQEAGAPMIRVWGSSVGWGTR
jgi:hypothetical protein